mgnify:CR=1 FL=1
MKKNKKIIYKNFIQKEYLKSIYNKTISQNYNKISKKIFLNLDKTEDPFHFLSKKFKFNFKQKDFNKFKKFKNVIVIGMGGSILGAEAIHCFLKKKIKKNFLFFDDIDQDKLKKIKIQQNLNKILFIVISKSGGTIETLLNFFALKIIKKNSKNIIIISEKNKGPLHLISEKMKLFHIEHRKNTGGRFSVLTETGIIPALLMGINLPQLRKNLLIHFQNKNKKFLKESSIKLTNLIKNKKFKNLIFLNYVPELDKFLYWNQQLIAESLGKNGIGFLPLISTVPKDYHSLLQLYLDGPRDKIFYIFSMNNNNNFKIKTKTFGKKLHFLNNKSPSQIKAVQKNALVQVLKKNKIPFREFLIDNDLNEKILGELFSYFMIETAIVGKLAKVNPFNQPAVEQVKINTRRLLN